MTKTIIETALIAANTNRGLFQHSEQVNTTSPRYTSTIQNAMVEVLGDSAHPPQKPDTAYCAAAPLDETTEAMYTTIAPNIKIAIKSIAFLILPQSTSLALYLAFRGYRFKLPVHSQQSTGVASRTMIGVARRKERLPALSQSGSRQIGNPTHISPLFALGH